MHIFKNTQQAFNQININNLLFQDTLYKLKQVLNTGI